MNQHQDRKLQRTQFCWVIVKTLNISNESRWKNSCQSSMQKIYWFSYFNAMRLKVRSASNEWGYFIYFRFSLESHEDNCQQQQYLCQWNEYHLEKTPFPRFTCVFLIPLPDHSMFVNTHEVMNIRDMYSSNATYFLCNLQRTRPCSVFWWLSAGIFSVSRYLSGKLIGRSAF